MSSYNNTGLDFNEMLQNAPQYQTFGLMVADTWNRAPTTTDTQYPYMYTVRDSTTNKIYWHVGTNSSGAIWDEVALAPGGVVPVADGGTGVATITNHGIVVGQGTSPIATVGPAASGTILQGAGGSADPAFSTATYPSTATGTGTFLRADGTNWLASTATLPNTAAQGDLLYASADDVWSSLAKNATQGMMLTNNGTNSAPMWQPAPAGISEGWSNLGVALAGGILSIVGETGTVISSTNPAIVKFNSKATPGTIKTLTLTTAPVGLTETELTSATFGTTAATAWADAMPFFLYAVLDSAETAVSFFISRNPCAQVTPATVYKAGTVASVTSQLNFFGLDSAATSANYASQPCVRVGSFRMVKSAGDAWTIQTLGSGLGGIGDGIGNYDENTYWVFPTGQDGARAGTYFNTDDAMDTIPTFLTGNYTYQLGNDGSVDIFMTFASVDTPGVSNATASLKFMLPLDNIEANISSPPGWFRYTTTIGNIQNPCMCLRDNDAVNGNFYTLWDITGAAFVIAGDIAATESNISCDITYQAFSGNG